MAFLNLWIGDEIIWQLNIQHKKSRADALAVPFFYHFLSLTYTTLALHSHIINHCKYYLFCRHLVVGTFLEPNFSTTFINATSKKRFVLSLLRTPYYPLLSWFWLISVEENGTNHECPAGDELEQRSNAAVSTSKLSIVVDLWFKYSNWSDLQTALYTCRVKSALICVPARKVENRRERWRWLMRRWLRGSRRSPWGCCPRTWRRRPQVIRQWRSFPRGTAQTGRTWGNKQDDTNWSSPIFL